MAARWRIDIGSGTLTFIGPTFHRAQMMPLTAVQAAAYLHHIALTSPDPERLARFYGEALDMSVNRQGGGWLARGPGRRVLVVTGPKNGLGYAAFGVRDDDGLAALRARAAKEGLSPEPASTDLMKPGAFSIRDPDGNNIVFGRAGVDASASGIRGPIQHITFATRDIAGFEAFYAGKLGFAVSDYVVREADGAVTTVFMRSNHEHHTVGVFLQDRTGVDHHSYEAGEWNVMKDWCDRFAAHHIRVDWGPGRHGPGNNLFSFITDPDGNWIELSAELEVVYDRPAKRWPHEERTINLWGPARMRA